MTHKKLARYGEVISYLLAGYVIDYRLAEAGAETEADSIISKSFEYVSVSENSVVY